MRNEIREQEEELLIAKIARGDTAALERLYNLYRPRLYRFLLALQCSQAELDEVYNETFYVVWRKAGTFDGSCRLSTWILGIARNKVLDSNRSERRRTMRHSDTDTASLPETRLTDAERLELSQCLQVALERLPDEQCAVIELAFLDGLSYQEIASLMDCPESTIKTRMFHARRKLRLSFPEFAETFGRRAPG